jgi:hypothetical protein
MTAKREKPVRIPLSFTDAIRGLLKVDPKQLKKRTAKKKAAPKNAAELPPEQRASRALPPAAKNMPARKAKKG